MSSYWYVIHTYSGHENKVKVNLEERIQALGLDDEVREILVPTQEVTEIKNGKKKTSKKIFFPGYILINTARELHPELPNEEDQRIWHLIKDTSGVMGFVSTGLKLTPLNEEEVENILNYSKEGGAKAPVEIDFEVGDKIKVIDGPFEGFPGEINEIDEQRRKLRVMISIFGRNTPVELEFYQVELIS
jgi:transcriptional antiterminator NusG